MNQRTLDILEYPRIRAEIAGFCMSGEGKEALLLHVPSIIPAEVRSLKALGIAWWNALTTGNEPKFSSWPPVSHLLPRLSVEGASLQAEDLYALGLFCDSVERFRSWAEQRSRQNSSGEISGANAGVSTSITFSDAALASAVSSLPDLSGPYDEIFKIIERSSGDVRDLPELRAIRQSIKHIKQDIDRMIGSYLSDDGLKSMLQSTLPTIRDGRQVISVRANFRGRVKGIVHEVSQSGQTLYIEPDDVVGRNNDLVTEESHLAREIARILRELTERIAPASSDISFAFERMVFFDGIGASVHWGSDHSCVFAQEVDTNHSTGSPHTSDEAIPALSLRQARHPLLGARAVPIDLVLIPGGRILIITGPNTGGKTVSLKTAALLSLLNQSGWPIPAGANTALPIFDYIGCDIGDEQSLDQSLSTFSGHMKNVAEILASVTEKSLVLLDELGSGTDPQEGSAIAMAVLDALLEKRPVVLVTTHHGVLKNYGYTHESCINASVDFDENTLSPTYRILMGIPGESHALDIAARNGLDPALIAGARSYLQSERADVSSLIKGLTAKHEELARFEKEKSEQEIHLQEKKRKADLKDLQLRQKELELREQGYHRLDRLFDESRKTLENLVRELREGELTREKTLQVKACLSEFEQRMNAEHEGLEKSREELGMLVQTAVVQEFAPGVEVYVGPQRRRGTIVRDAGKGKWVVATDSLKMTVKESTLAAVPVQGGAGSSRIVPMKALIELQGATDGDIPAFELKLLGMRHDEAVKALERQLDLAAMKGLKNFSVIHGKGNGILQQMVQELLANTRTVGEFHFARPEDGGSGKTIVTMR